MLIQLEDFRSNHPDFAAPKKQNGEPMELFSVEATGQYLVARYFNLVPIEGPKLERYFVDLYFNPDGRETFRVTTKIVEPPPLPPTFRQRLSLAFHQLFD